MPETEIERARGHWFLLLIRAYLCHVPSFCKPPRFPFCITGSLLARCCCLVACDCCVCLPTVNRRPLRRTGRFLPSEAYLPSWFGSSAIGLASISSVEYSIYPNGVRKGQKFHSAAVPRWVLNLAARGVTHSQNREHMPSYMYSHSIQGLCSHK